MRDQTTPDLPNTQEKKMCKIGTRNASPTFKDVAESEIYSIRNKKKKGTAKKVFKDIVTRTPRPTLVTQDSDIINFQSTLAKKTKGTGKREVDDTSTRSTLSPKETHAINMAYHSIPPKEKKGKGIKGVKYTSPKTRRKTSFNDADAIEAIELNTPPPKKKKGTVKNWGLWWKKKRKISKTGTLDLEVPTKSEEEITVDADVPSIDSGSLEKTDSAGITWSLNKIDSSETVVRPVMTDSNLRTGDSFIQPITWSESTEPLSTLSPISSSIHRRYRQRRMSPRRSIFLYLSRSGSLDTSVYEMLKDCRYYLQHPYLRIVTALTVMCLNFLLYSLDPTAYSKVDASLPILGDGINLLFYKYPPNNHLSEVKVAMWLFGFVSGVMAGYLCHKLIFNRIMRLHIFAHNNGMSMTLLVSIIFCNYAFSKVYNRILDRYDVNGFFYIDSTLPVKNDFFTKLNAIATWFGDFITTFMVTDVILQEKLYPPFFKKLRKWWNRKYNRIYMFYIMLVFGSTIVVFFLQQTHSGEELIPKHTGTMLNNELSRNILATVIIMVDIAIFMQDWDFPHFCSVITIKLPGTNVKHIFFQIPRSNFCISITGKCFNYGILGFIIMLDIFVWISMITYNPAANGQYVHPENHSIYSVTDEFSVRNYHNSTLLSFEFRSKNINPDTGKYYLASDVGPLNARFVGVKLHTKLVVAVFPVIITIWVFILLFLKYGRYPLPTPDNPYVGRLRSIEINQLKAANKKNEKHKPIEKCLEKLRSLKRKQTTEVEDGNGNLKPIGSSWSGFNTDKDDKPTNSSVGRKSPATQKQSTVTIDEKFVHKKLGRSDAGTPTVTGTPLITEDDLKFDTSTTIVATSTQSKSSSTTLSSIRNWFFGTSL